jgi:hypothetical protein
MGFFTGIEQADISGTKPYFETGTYVVDIMRVFTLTSRKQQKLFIIECEIVESDNPNRPPGMECSQVIVIKPDTPAMGNVLAFIAASQGIDPYNTANKELIKKEITEAFCEYVVTKENPLGGKRLRLKCAPIKTKADTDFTVHYWGPYAAAA